MRRPIPIYRGSSIAAFKTFQAFSGLSGVDNLDPNLTINGTTVTPTFRYKGGDADGTDWDAWGYGETLTLQATPAPSYNQGSPCLGANDDSVKFNVGGYYLGSDNTIGDSTTEDLVWELVFKMPPAGSNETLCAKRNASNAGWELQVRSDSTIRLYIEDDTTTTTYFALGAQTPNSWIHLMIFLNKDENSVNGTGIYANTSGGQAGNPSSVGSLSNTGSLAMGADSNGNDDTQATIAYFGFWKQASWHQAGAAGPTEWATVAAERFAKLCGYYPSKANGTAMPTTATRAFPAYLTKHESGVDKLYYVGGEWLRQDYRQDASAVDVKGYLPETQAENLFTYSEDFSTWDLIEAGTVVVDNAAICPDGRTAAASIAGDAGDEQHGISDDITLTAATHAFSAFYKAGNKTWLYLSDSTVANAYCYFDVANGTVGTSGANATGYIEGPFYSGDATPIYRCCIVFTGTVAAHTLEISPAEADTDNDFIGDGSTVNGYVWNAQVEQSDYMRSPIVTSGATKTRLKDQLQFPAGANIGGEDVGQGTIVADMLNPDMSPSGTKSITAISDGGATADRLVLYHSTFIRGVTAATGGDAGSCLVGGDVFDNNKHEARLIYNTDDVYVSLDGTDGTADSSADIPDDLDEIDIGQDNTSGSQFNGLISNFRIYKKPVKSG